MKHVLWTAVVLALLGGAGPAMAGDLPAAETTAPAGDYQAAWLKLEKGWEKGADVALFLGLRGGQATAVWFCAPARGDCHRMWADEVTVKLAGDSLKGEVKGRMAKVWAPIAHVGDYAYALDARVSGGKVAGTFTARIALKDQKEQTATGTLMGTLAGEEQLRKEQALPAGKDWPGYYGVGSAFRGPECGARMIADLGAARPLWKAEEPLPCMWGKGPDGRYKMRACVVGVDGGASSPVVAGGLAYVFYFRPAGPLANEPQLREEAAKHTPSPLGHQAYVEWHRPLADDIVVCLDAATGKTVWRTVLKERGVNLQTHKWRGFNPVPLVADGVVYVVDYANRVYALDARAGKLLWEYGKGSKQFTASAAGPLLADGVLVASLGEMVGLDPKTGRELWKGPGGNLLLWRKEGKDRVIALAEHRFKDAAGKNAACLLVSCFEPRAPGAGEGSGKVLWKAETPLWSPRDVGPLIEGGFLVGCEATKGEKPGEADFAKETQVLCYRLKEDGLEKAWAAPAPYPAVDKLALAIANGHVYVAGSQETFCLKLDTGERVGVAKAGGARTQTMFAADSRVFIQPEGRHGGQSFYMLDGDPKGFRVLPASGGGDLKHPGAGQWVPPHVHDTAYANHPVGYPLVDGRLFVRGHDGLYCYDLREAAPATP
ncbi:MAG: hypothetical protein FJ290_09190 [Planctomycetes bacterium]|nr:hypothetical protein [Planctomycetota bacterium]